MRAVVPSEVHGSSQATTAATAATRLQRSAARQGGSRPAQRQRLEPKKSRHRTAEDSSGGPWDPSTDQATMALLQASCWLPDAIGQLVRKPLSEFASACVPEMYKDDGDSLLASSGPGSLTALSVFLRRTLQALVDLQEASHSQQSAALQEAMLQWLVRTREELCVWGQRAGRAVKALSTGASQQLGIQELGTQLQSFIQGSIGEALKQGSFQFDQELAQLRTELQETRSLAAAAAAEARKQEAIAASNEGAFLAKSLDQLLSQKFQDHAAAEEEKWQKLREEVTRSRAQVVGELTEQQHQSVRQLQLRLSELWESQNLQRDRELQLLREHAESAMVQMRSSVGSAEMAYSKAAAEQGRAGKVLSEMQAERLAHDKERALGQREREALALQLTQAMSTSRSFVQLQKSLSEEQARPEPVQQMMNPQRTRCSSAGPVPHSKKEPDRMEDGSTSVCRISTDSVQFRRAADLPTSADPSLQTRRRTVLEERPVSEAKDVAEKPAVAPWDLPAKDFLSLWRQSQATSATASGLRKGAAQSGSSTDKDAKHGDVSPSPSTDTLRITASWD